MNAPATQAPSDDDGDESSGVVIPEEFQQQAHKLLSRADKHQLNHVSDRISARREELMQEEMAAKQKASASKDKGKKAVPEMMDASMPGSPMMD